MRKVVVAKLGKIAPSARFQAVSDAVGGSGDQICPVIIADVNFCGPTGEKRYIPAKKFPVAAEVDVLPVHRYGLDAIQVSV